MILFLKSALPELIQPSYAYRLHLFPSPDFQLICVFFFFKNLLLFFLISVSFIYLLYNIVLVLPYPDMNPPWVYMCSASWTPPHLPPHPIPLGHPRAWAWSTLYHASNLDWWFVSHMIIYMFQCHSPKSSHPCPLPLSPKDCSIHLCLFCCLAYRIIITIFLNSIYVH